MTDLDRIKGPLARLIRWVMRDATYARRYPATVLGQNGATGRLDLRADDPDIRGTGTSGVPIRHGFPGASVTVPTGARVLLAFEENDPRKPIAMLWERETDFVMVNVGALHVTPTGVDVGAGANFVALANLVLAELNAQRTWASTHTHSGVTAGAAVTLIPAVPPPAVGAVASSNLKAD
jgi:hypothetical protein